MIIMIYLFKLKIILYKYNDFKYALFFLLLKNVIIIINNWLNIIIKIIKSKGKIKINW